MSDAVQPKQECVMDILDDASQNSQEARKYEKTMLGCGRCSVKAKLEEGVTVHYGNDCIMLHGEIITAAEM